MSCFNTLSLKEAELWMKSYLITGAEQSQQFRTFLWVNGWSAVSFKKEALGAALT